MKGINNVNLSVAFRVISVLLVIFIIPFQVILEQPLMDISLNLIVSLQDVRTDAGIIFFKFFQYFGNGIFINLVAPAIYNFLNPSKSPSIIIYSTLVHYIGNLIGLILQEVRPFWFSSRIKSELCSDGYGNPSIPLLITSTFLPIITIETFHDKSYRHFIYGIIGIVISANSFGMVYLGENFPHQVVTSLFFGFVFVTVYFSLYKEISNFCQDSCYNYYKNRIYMMYWAFFVFSLVSIEAVLQIIIYVTPSNYPKSVSNSAKHCSVNYEPDGTYNSKSSLEVFYAVGFVYGCLLNSRRMSIYWVITSWWKRLIRFLICAGINLATIVAFDAIPTVDEYTQAVFHYILPNFILSFSYTYLLPLVFAKFSLISLMKPEVDQESALNKTKNRVAL